MLLLINLAPFATYAQKATDDRAAATLLRDDLTLRLLPNAHPALTASTAQHTAYAFGGRELWGLEGAPGHMGFHYGLSLKKDLKGLGFGVDLGYGSSLGASQLNATATAVYGLEFGGDGTHILRLAVSGGLQNQSYDMSTLRFGNQYIMGRNLYGNQQPLDLLNIGGVQGQLGAGAFYQIRNFFVDVSALGLLQNPSISLSSGYRFRLLSGDLEIMPVAQLQTQLGRWLPSAWVQGTIFSTFVVGGGYMPERVFGLLAYEPFRWLRVGAEAGLEVGGLRGVGAASFRFSARIGFPFPNVK